MLLFEDQRRAFGSVTLEEPSFASSWRCSTMRFAHTRKAQQQGPRRAETVSAVEALVMKMTLERGHV